ncbi:hypothetical protein L3X38_008799 [Prunus dulcis]|uniref:Uncharacterized protein n=1 Tax=Prunus dulcis TaxID=3755 RepID=A0AAD4ZX79_PRUDU|nr:hypothetical protein L3X38_008799 [Prunus dulcis]
MGPISVGCRKYHRIRHGFRGIQVKERAVEIVKAIDDEDGLIGALNAFHRHFPHRKSEDKPASLPASSGLFCIRCDNDLSPLHDYVSPPTESVAMETQLPDDAAKPSAAMVVEEAEMATSVPHLQVHEAGFAPGLKEIAESLSGTLTKSTDAIVQDDIEGPGMKSRNLLRFE